jgi:hypothetical protein
MTGPCTDEGAKRNCHEVLDQREGYVDCFNGTQTCTGGIWTSCQGDASGGTVTTHAVTRGGASGGLSTSSLGSAGTAGPSCTSDPCNPYCNGYDETPTTPIVPPPGVCGMTANGTNAGCSGGSDTGIGACATNADCEQDWHCQGAVCVWNGATGYFDPACKDGAGNPGVDLTLGVPCDAVGSYNIPVCNRGGGTLGIGKVIALENDGNGGHPVWNCAASPTPTVSGGSASCTYTLVAPLGPGQCVIINTLTTPGCNALETGHRDIFVNWNKSIVECGTGFPSPAGTGPGCMNNSTETKATGSGCPALCAPAPGGLTYAQTYAATCPTGTHAQWNHLSYNVTTTAGADVKFAVQTGPSATGPWLPAVPALIADAPTDHPSLCSVTGPSPCGGAYAATCKCPVDMFVPLGGKPNAQQSFLNLTTNISGSSCAVATPVVLIYAHSGSTLYSVNPVTFAVTTIGPFKDTGGSSINNMTDIAVDKNGLMYGVTSTRLYKIAYVGPTAVCTFLSNLSSGFNGLTFIPSSLMGTANEVLIGAASDGGWWRIDLAPVTLTLLGYYGGSPGVIGSSGDSVGIIGDQVYATVTGLGGSDHIITVDPKTGLMITDIGSTGVSGLWGLGYWGGKAYGFASSGNIYTINLTTGAPTLVSAGNPGWWGAAVTTSVNIPPVTTGAALNSWQVTYDCVPSE